MNETLAIPQGQDDGQRWVVVVAPRGDVLRLDADWDTQPAFAVICSLLEGTTDDGTKAWATGSHVSMLWREPRRT